MRIFFLILTGIFLIGLVSAFPVINEITINPQNPLVTEDVTICANITDEVSMIFISRINLYASSPEWRWGLVMNDLGNGIYCRTLSPQLMDAYDGKEIIYYVSGRNSLGEIETSSAYSFIYTSPPPTPFCGDGTCDSGENCSSCEIDCGSCPPEPEPDDDDDKEHTGHTTGVKSYCVPSWKCTEWSSCNSKGVRTRVCYDKNSCYTSYNKPNEVAGCETIKKVSVSSEEDVYITLSAGLMSAIFLISVMIFLVARR